MNTENPEVPENTEENKPVWGVVRDDAPMQPQEVISTFEPVVPTAEELIADPVVDEPAEPVVEPTPEPEPAPEPAPTEIDDVKVIDFLKAKGINAESIEDLKPKEQKKLSPEIEKYLEYNEKTGRGYEDFLQTQKDWKAEPQDNVLMKYLREQNPTLSDDKITFLYNKKYAFDPELDTDDFVMEQQINVEQDYQRALALLEKQKEEFMVVRGADDSVPLEYREAKRFYDELQTRQKENEELAAASLKGYQSATEQVFSQGFDGFKTKIGDREFSIKPADVTKTLKTQSDLANFNNRFFDQNGTLKDPAGFHKAYFFADNPDLVAEHFFNLGKAAQVEADEIASKNISIPGMQPQRTAPVDGKAWKQA